MSLRTKKYPTYKTTNFEYLGDIPLEWTESRLANLFNFSKGYGLSKGELTEDKGFDCVLYGELYTKYKNYLTLDSGFSQTNSDSGFISKGNEILIPASTTTTGVDLACAKVLTKEGVRIGGM